MLTNIEKAEKDEKKLSDLISKLNERMYAVECILEEKLDLCEVDGIIVGLVKEEIDAIDFKITVER